ncbi:MAG TPA: c-type cytochrome [Vicinamibacteria bacterium]
MIPNRAFWLLFPVGVVLAPAPASPLSTPAQGEREQSSGTAPTSEALYRAACASCHGVDGRGAPRGQVGFEDPLPDFTDCSFATREPNADWLAVTHSGGPARGFGEMMPAFGDALSLEDMERTVDYLRTFCTSDAWPRGELNLPRPFVTEKAYPEDEAVLSTATALDGTGSSIYELVYERRFGARNQLELVVPFGFQERAASDDGTAGEWTGGHLGDVAVAAKRAFYHNYENGTILSAAGELKLPTGDEDVGLGKGTAAFEPFVSFGQILPAGAFVHLQAGVELPFDGDAAEAEAFWRFAPGVSFVQGRFGRTWSPMVELLGARELESGAETEWDLVPQMQVTLNQRQHVMVNVGVRVPLNGGGSRHEELLIYLLWDFFDGGFFEGW